MAKDWTIAQSDFEALLAWLHPDRDEAALRYEEIRTQLIRIFVSRGLFNAEELADETINRVTRKVGEIAGTYVGDAALFFYGVARNVYKESLRPDPVAREWERPVRYDEDAVEYECLERCMEVLPPQSRRLILLYYEEVGQAKIDMRKRLAAELGIDMNALRLRARRIRARLEHCVSECMEGSGKRPDIKRS